MQAEQTLQQVDTLSEALQASAQTDWSLLYRTPVYDILSIQFYRHDSYADTV